MGGSASAIAKTEDYGEGQYDDRHRRTIPAKGFSWKILLVCLLGTLAGLRLAAVGGGVWSWREEK